MVTVDVGFSRDQEKEKGPLINHDRVEILLVSSHRRDRNLGGFKPSNPVKFTTE